MDCWVDDGQDDDDDDDDDNNVDVDVAVDFDFDPRAPTEFVRIPMDLIWIERKFWDYCCSVENLLDIESHEIVFK